LFAGALSLEEEAIRRARDGVRRMKFNPKTGEPYIDPETGKPYLEHEYSDNLMLALLKRHFPDYRERAAPELHVNASVTNVCVLPESKRLELIERRKAALASSMVGDGERCRGTL